MSPRPTRRQWLRALWRQLPFFVWLVVLWMLLWAQFTPLSFLTGLLAAGFTMTVFRLPPAEMSGRLSLWHSAKFITLFLAAVVNGSLTVAAQVLDFRKQPGTAVVAVPLRTDDDLIMNHTGVTASLIPGSLIIDSDRDQRILYLHVIGVSTPEEAEAFRGNVQRWEKRITQAVGSRADLKAIAAAEQKQAALKLEQQQRVGEGA